MDPSLGFTGGEAMAKRLAAIAARFPDRTAAALRIEAELIMTRSKRDFVPVDKGVLKASGHVSPPKRVGNTTVVEMSYGGPASAYAIAVHEYPSKYNPPSWDGVAVRFHPGGHGSKYLERPLMDAIPSLPSRIAARLLLSELGTEAPAEPADTGGGEGGGADTGGEEP